MLHDRFTALHPLQRSPGLTVYNAQEKTLLGQSNPDANQVRLLVFSGSDAQATLRRISGELRLVRLIDSPAILLPLEVNSAHDNNYIVYPNPPAQTLRQWLERNADEHQQLSSLTTLLTTLVDLHRVGVAVGFLTADSIYVENGACVFDPLGLVLEESDNKTNADAESELNQSNRQRQDAAAIAKLIQPIFERCRDSALADAMPARQSAIVHRMLLDVSNLEVANAPSLQELLLVLQPLCVLDPNNAHTEDPDKTIERLDNDLTAESIEIKQADFGVEDNDSTHLGLLFDDEDSTDADFSIEHDLPAKVSFTTGQTIGRFKLGEQIGQGGMGTVYKALDLSSGEDVAVKIIRGDMAGQAQAMRRLQKESRVMRELCAPQIMRLIDAGEDQGVHYLALELIQGSDLKRELRQIKKFEPIAALEIICEIAKGLSVAHQLGIIHRDVKPENVMLARRKPEGNNDQTLPDGAVVAGLADVDLSDSNSFVAREKFLDIFAVKVSDFGLARHAQQTVSLEVTVAGSLLGTPNYMSPEQCKGGLSVSPASDIYSLGVMLYEMIAGELPFKADDAIRLVAMHCFNAAPDLRRSLPQIPDAIADLTARMLQKDPVNRLADASQLIETIEAILHGSSAPDAVHTTIDQSQLNSGLSHSSEYVWELASSPEALWPFVSNTDRLNRAIGLSSVKFTTEKNIDGKLEKFGSFKIGPLSISWLEHPFEWIEAQKMGILRSFHTGPFKLFSSIVSLERLPGGGTRLRHAIKILPRNLLGVAVAKFELGRKAKNNLTRVYKQIDRFIQQTDSRIADAFEGPTKTSTSRITRINQRRDQMIAMGADSDEALSFASLIGSLSPQAAAKIRAIPLADKLTITAEKSIELCLMAASVGMLQLAWDLICPTCRAPAGGKSLLSQIARHSHCEACDVDFATDLGNAVELVFSVSKDITDFDDNTYCVGGPYHAPHVVVQTIIPAGEQVSFNTTLPVGSYVLRGPDLLHNVSLTITDRFAPSTVSLDLRPTTDLLASDLASSLRAGGQVIRLNNQYPREIVVRLERTTARNDLVTAAHAATVPLFRSLFPDQIIQSGVVLQSEHLCVLVTNLSDASSLYDGVDEATAYQWLMQQLESQVGIVALNRGTLVKTLGEGIVAVFQDSGDAFAAASAIALQNEVQSVAPKFTDNSDSNYDVDPKSDLSASRSSSNASLSMTLADMSGSAILSDSQANLLAHADELSGLIFTAALHRGRTFITATGGRNEHYGTTIRAALAMPLRISSGVLLTDTVSNDPIVVEALARLNCEVEIIADNLPGLPNQLMQHIHNASK